MDFKNIFLSLVLLPLLSICDNSDTTEKLIKLESDFETKVSELAHIEKMIQEKEELINGIRERNITLAYNIYSALDAKEKTIFEEELDLFDAAFSQALVSGSDITKYLKKEIYNHHSENRKALERIKFVLIRQAVEYFLLTKLFNSYERCLVELTALSNELNSNK